MRRNTKALILLFCLALLGIPGATAQQVMIRVEVDYTLTPKQALNETEHRQYIDGDVLNTIPHKKGVEDVEVTFFQIGRSVGNRLELEKAYKERGLIPAHLLDLIKVNADDSSFADSNPNATLWRNKSGELCFAVFIKREEGRTVDISCLESFWDDWWWFAGVRDDRKPH